MHFWWPGSGEVGRVGHVSESIELSTKMNSCMGIQDAQTSICETVLEIMTMSKYSQYVLMAKIRSDWRAYWKAVMAAASAM